MSWFIALQQQHTQQPNLGQKKILAQYSGGRRSSILSRCPINFDLPFQFQTFLFIFLYSQRWNLDVWKSVLESHSFEVEKQQFFVRDTREIRNIMSRWFTSFAVEKKLGHMNQNDIGRRHCQTYNFRAFLYFEGIYGISFFFSRSGTSFLLFHVPVFIFSFPVPFNANFSSFAYCCAKNWSILLIGWRSRSCLSKDQICSIFYLLAKARRIEDENQ